KIYSTSKQVVAIAAIILAAFAFSACRTTGPTREGAVDEVTIFSDGSGHKLQVNGKDFFVKGMNWDYYPPGTNYAYSLWAQSDSFIKKALKYEMSLLRELGVNTIRQYVDIPPRWVKYIYEEYGIYTILNHPFARYGFEYDGQWHENVDYTSLQLKVDLLAEIDAMVDEYQETPGILMWLLGNENNYGLAWGSSATHDIPDETQTEFDQAKALYALMNDAIVLIHEKDELRPVAMANGDVQFVDLVASQIPDLDIFGTNVYRGESFGDLFEVVKTELGIPVLFTEFGADAYDALKAQEDQNLQVKYLLSNWEEIYKETYNNGSNGNALGGCTFQFSDGWWKTDLDSNLDIHDTRASWRNGGYSEDYHPGLNNMNEEWFGICAKGPVDPDGHYALYPRNAYSALREVHALDPYFSNVDQPGISFYFSMIRESQQLMTRL
ncbi:MAG: glycosidase, partial [Candidatus Marinimicrobia bacterium]|nr:glycosidase [Candidatus Neomarinimicrobiota bacterium]